MKKVVAKKQVVTQPSARMVAARTNGRAGGLTTASRLNPAQRVLRSAKAGATTSFLYGSDYFRHIASKRKFVGRYRTPVEN